MKRVSGGIAVLFALSGFVCAEQGCGGRGARVVGPGGDGGEEGSTGDDTGTPTDEGGMPGQDGGLVSQHDSGTDGGGRDAAMGPGDGGTGHDGGGPHDGGTVDALGPDASGHDSGSMCG